MVGNSTDSHQTLSRRSFVVLTLACIGKLEMEYKRVKNRMACNMTYKKTQKRKTEWDMYNKKKQSMRTT